MPTLHVSDSIDQDRPLFLISGSLPNISHPFISSLTEEFKVIVLNNSHKYQANENFYQVYNTAIGTIKNLSDKLDYAVFFLIDSNDKKILEQLVPKLEKDKPRTLILVSVSQIHDFIDVIQAVKSISSISFAIIGDVFGSDISPSVSRVSKVVHTALTEKRADFIGSELISVYPISQNDILKGIPYVLFSNEKPERVFFFFYEHPQTIISTIHLLKRIEPDLQIQYDTHSSEFASVLSHKELEESIHTKTRLKSTYLETIFEGFEKSVRSLTYPTKLKSLSKKRKTRIKSLAAPKFSFQTPITVITCAILLFLVINVLLTLAGVVLAKQAVNSLENGNFQNAKTQLTFAQKSLSWANPTVSTGFEILRQLPIPGIEQSYQLFKTGIDLTSLATRQLVKIDTVTTGLSESDLLESLATLTYLYFTAQSSPQYERLPYFNKLTNISTSNVLTTLSVLPQILGYEEEKNYLLLFQNNGELRPTGGFIGSVGSLRVKNGKVEEFTIQDVYDIDGQIKTHTEPPFIVRRYLQPHLYLRDSNFSLDFQEAATTAAQLYQNGGGKQVDGVIALDYEVLKKIIEVTGPLYLPSYNRTIDAQNGFDFIQSTIEDTFSPGNSQKKSILSEVFTQLLFKIEDHKNLLAIAQILPTMIEQKHILFAFKDPSVQEIFTTQSYGGTISSIESTDTHFNDYLAINEANIGANKANIHVTRAVNINQTLLTDTLSSEATITLDNTKGEEIYKVYLRFVTLQDNIFETLTINGKLTPTVPAITTPRLYESPSFKIPNEIELTEEIYQGKNVFGFVHSVPAGKKEVIKVNYSRDISLSDDLSEYSFIYQLQPGTTGTPLTLALNFPSEYTFIDPITGITAQQKISSSQLVTKDLIKKLQVKKSTE